MASLGGMLALMLVGPTSWTSPPPRQAFSRRAACTLGAAVAVACAPHSLASSATQPLLTETFPDRSLGLVLRQAAGRVQVEKVVPGSAAAERGVLPLSFVDAVDGQKLGNATAAEVSALLKRAPRPITLTFDASVYEGLAADDALARAAASQGIETERVRITPLKGAAGCGLQSREGDVVEVEFSARVAAPDGGREFDSSARRSGRPFAFLLGNGDVVRGFELGCFEMCIGDERLVRTPLPSTPQHSTPRTPVCSPVKNRESARSTRAQGAGNDCSGRRL